MAVILIRILLLASVLAAQPVLAQVDLTFEGRDRFRLWNDCRPVVMDINQSQMSSEKLNSLGIKAEDIQIPVRSRLRSARLFIEEHGYQTGQLSFEITVTPLAFNINAFFFKLVNDIASGETRFAITWVRRTTGHYAQDPTYIQSSVTQLTDRFIDDYLRVNEEACA